MQILTLPKLLHLLPRQSGTQGQIVTIGSANGDIAKSLGAPDGSVDGVYAFLSLGLGGIAIFNFDTEFNISTIVFESTWGNRAVHPEYADVYVADSSFDTNYSSFLLDSQGYSTLSTNGFTYAGSINNSTYSTVVDLASLTESSFNYVLIVDTTQENGGILGGGFDIDAVGVTPVPAPSTFLLLGFSLFILLTTKRD